MQSNQSAYNQWASQYDTNKNATRDLEGTAIRQMLAGKHFGRVLEIGCGTGKNTVWLAEHAEAVTAVDFSPGMLAEARAKAPARVHFVEADISQPWHFAEGLRYDLITFSLILEHLPELHPFKQYSGSLARFDSDGGRVVLECHQHHISEFFGAAKACGLSLVSLQEWWDDEDNRSLPPRILTLLFEAA